MRKINSTAVLKQLISISSYVDEKNNERKLGEYITHFLRINAPWLGVSIQNIENNRYNIIATDGSNPKIIFICHMDTVQPSNNMSETLIPLEKDGFVYGLGAADMKGGMAALLSALTDTGKTNGAAFIFDCDEEYYFLGIKKLLKEYLFKPDLVIFPEPSDLQIVNGCRGVIEIELDVIGKTAHAGVPKNGINAIEKAVALVNRLRKYFTMTKRTELGKSTVNLSKLTGGRLYNGEIVTQANAVPDIAKVLFDIRTADPKLSAQSIIKLIKNISVTEKIKVKNFKINLDYSGYLTNKSELSELTRITRGISKEISFRKSIERGGFFEGSFVSKAWGCSAISLGPGDGKTSHTENERVSISDIETIRGVYRALLNCVKV